MLTKILKLAVPSRAARRSLRVLQATLKDTSQTIFREVWFGNRQRALAAGRESLLVNVGCGDITAKDWINLDSAHPTDTRHYYNALNPLPFASESVEHLHTEHFLEHLEYLDGRIFLQECYRVLKPGSSARIIVPDLEKYVRAYCANERLFFEQFVALGGSEMPLSTRALVCNQMFQMGGHHKFAWDYETLSGALRETGFNVVEQSSKNDVETRYRIDGQDWWREIESMYVNARK
jgi:predicted SAM-dependent methyltransferase